ncbi:Protein of unknown function DUF262 [Methylomagnum ishizawai]|uniref:GmrSD restriction endonucleases N-terminal domain-containing protein n=1 Tax=Methylomagnum ishizawai TaxID=1760988 RepID=A0A1Y6D0R3_9GAMM|nr:DUF262 domain-containing protein [Methylomagnum ishizawai]SMF96176.1 Protein of unknown function DUF262 [Methylomagnum ishizawai]
MQQEKSVEEEIEGLDRDEDSGWGDYPIDTVWIRTETRTIHDVLRRIEKGSFVMNPDFQRDFIWSEDKQSKLIESVLMRIPLPVFYLAEDEEGRMIVVDGLQRLSTFNRFVKNELKLRLKKQAELNKKKFENLSPKMQNRIEDCNLILYVIDAKVPERARLDIFERVNGGVPLTRQQMRNCIYMGAATTFLREEAETDLFVQATGKSLTPSTMRDREFVNRFCAFRLLGLESYRGDMDEFLGEALKKMNGLEKSELNKLSADFRNGLSNNLKVFDRHAFRRCEQDQHSRKVINASLWDVMSIGLSKYNESMVEAHAEELRNVFFARMKDGDFIASINYATSDVKQVKFRFYAAKKMFEEVFGAYPD